MNNSIQNFSFQNQSVRIFADNPNAPEFVAKDVAVALGYRDAINAIKLHCKGVVKHHPLATDGGKQNVRVITEPDVYRLVFGSKLESATKFQDWVFEEVLPQIRKTGQYQTEQPQPEPTPTPQVGDYWLSVGKDGRPHIVPLDKDQIITNPSNIMCLRSLLALIPTYQLHEFMKHCTEEVINRAKGMLA